MSDNESTTEETTEQKSSFIAQNRFIIMIFGAVFITIIVTSITISMYFSSGTAQLDQSRPGYQSLKGKTRQEDPFKAFPSTGAVDDAALGEFKKIYDKRANDATSVDAFSSDVLSDQALSIDDGMQDQPNQ